MISPGWGPLWLLLALASITACDPSNSKTFVAPAPTRCAVGVKATVTTFPATGGWGTLEISTARECSWTAQAEVPWIALAPEARGQGDGSVRYTIAANADPDGRGGRLTVGEVQTAISQEGRPCEFTLSSTHETVGSSGGALTIGVDASHARCTWTVVSGVPWIAIDGASSRSGSGEVTIRVDVGTPQARSGTIELAGQQVTVEQATVEQVTCSAAPSITELATGHSGGRLEVPVVAPAGCPWSARSDIPWISIAGPGTATGNGVVQLDVAPTSGPARTAMISVAGQNIRVQQTGGCVAAPALSSASVTAAGGRIEIPVQAGAGCPWTAQSGSSWISIAGGAEGSGPGTIVLAAAASDGPPRTGVVMVAGIPVTVTQSSGCRYSVQPLSYSAPAGGATTAVTLQTAPGCPWTSNSGEAWITLPQIPPAGPASVPVVVAANNGPSRTGTFTVAGTAITVVQGSPCTWTLAPPSVDYGPDGGRGAVLVIVTGPCTWTAASTASWISLDTGAAGTGDGLVQFTVAANPGPTRSGVLRIAGIDLVVRQAGR